MAGLVAAVRDFAKGVDARHQAEHDNLAAD
jgi:hypothetical protein